MASVKERNGSYTITVTDGSKNGKKKQVHTTWKPDPTKTKTQNKKDLEYFIADFERKVKGDHMDAAKMTFADLVEDWRENHGKSQLQPTTLEKTDYALKLVLPHLEHIKLVDLRSKDIDNCLKAIRKEGYVRYGKRCEYAETTIKTHLGAVSSVFGYAVDKEIIEKNPCATVKLPKVKAISDTDQEDEFDGIKFFTVDQAQALLSFLEEPYNVVYRGRKKKDGSPSAERIVSHEVPEQIKLFLNMAINCGFRRGELVALPWKNLDLKKGTASVKKSTAYTKELGQHTKDPKNKPSYRIVPLTPSVVAMLKEYKTGQAKHKDDLGTKWRGSTKGGDLWQASQSVFTQWNGKPMHINTMSHTFTKILKRYNAGHTNSPLPLIPLHGLRHTTASIMIANGVDAVTVSAILGHADTQTTLRIYAHFFEEAKEKAINIMDDVLNAKGRRKA